MTIIFANGLDQKELTGARYIKFPCPERHLHLSVALSLLLHTLGLMGKSWEIHDNS